MGFFNEFWEEVSNNERKIKKRKPTNTQSIAKRKYVDLESLVKIIMAWLVGGIISLMPIFTHILSELWSKNRDTFSIEKAVATFFATEDLFLVITTLTVGALFEIIFNSKNNVCKYIVTGIEIVLVVCSIHVFSMLQSNVHLPKEEYIGVVLMALCLFTSVIGYFLVCLKRGDE